MGDKLIFWVQKLLRRCLALIDKTYIYASSYGIKAINGKLSLAPLDSYPVEELDSNQLFLFFDGLEDEHTMLDLPIKQSPHFGFMKSLENHEAISTCEYIHKAESGKLDMRPPTFYPASMYQARFERLALELKENTVNPILVYLQEGKYYILDGKHRAAYLALHQKKIPARIITSLKDDPFLQKIYLKMSKHRSNRFTRTIDLLNIVLDKEKISDN